MHRRTFVGSMIASLGAWAIAGCSGGGDQAALEDAAGSEREKRDLMGIGMVVRMPDRTTIYHASSGTVAPGGAPYDTKGSLQVLGSVTKLYTAVMILQLVEEQMLSLSDTVEGLVDVPHGDSLTLRELLEHRSGLADYVTGMTPEELGRAWTPEELVARAVSLGPIGPRGDMYARYANTNFTILALAIQAATGKSWSDNLRERIALPLGLTRTSDVAELAPGSVVEGWAKNGNAWSSSAGVVHPSIGWGIGSIVSTTEELHAFAAALFDGRLFRDPGTLASMTAELHPIDPAMLGGSPPGTSIGLAMHHFDVDGIVLVGHHGHSFGYDAVAALDPDTGALIAVTTNTEVAGAAGLSAYDIAVHIRSA